MEFVLFEQVSIGGLFVHNAINYRRVSRGYAEMDSEFGVRSQNSFFNAAAKVQVLKQKKV